MLVDSPTGVEPENVIIIALNTANLDVEDALDEKWSLNGGRCTHTITAKVFENGTRKPPTTTTKLKYWETVHCICVLMLVYILKLHVVRETDEDGGKIAWNAGKSQYKYMRQSAVVVV